MPQAGGGKAAFLVATHHRPHLLRASLQCLADQQVPPGWTVEILVGGEANDPGAAVARAVQGVRYIDVPSAKVTDKLNLLARSTNADLLLMADDDDLQPPNRLQAAVQAYQQGAQWSASGVHRFVKLETGEVARWEGKARTGHVGTSVSVAREAFLQVKGYPSVTSGKDGHLAYRLTAIKAPFRDISAQIGDNLICLQHGKNLNTRPFPARGRTTVKGKFTILGEGTLTEAHLPLAAKRAIEDLVDPGTLRISVAVTTYNRPAGCLRLLQDIARERIEGLLVTVFDDASTEDYQAVQQFVAEQDWQFIRAAQNHGKKQWWKWIGQVLAMWDANPASYFYILQDDIRLCQRFFARSLELWGQIADPNKASLCLLRDDLRSRLGSSCWTSYASHVEGAVERTQWVDCSAVLCTMTFVQTLKGMQPLRESRWGQDALKSSGVGEQWSKRLHAAGKGMFWPKQSYVLHLDQNISKMNPRARKTNQLRAVNYIDGPEAEARISKEHEMITASLATIPSRRASLQDVVARLLPQVDRLNVYLNETPALPGPSEYPKLPKFLDHPKITAVWSQDTPFGDQGDAGKFFWAAEVQNFHVICDDDMRYPPDFIEKLLEGLQRYDLKAVVGFHGAVLTEPFTSYYASRRTFHFSQALAEDRAVHVLASNSLAYHADTIQVHRDDFRHPNMGDIWFALLAQQQKVPLRCLAHAANWLVDDPKTREDSIFAHSRTQGTSQKNTAAVQTQVVQANMPWVLPGTAAVAAPATTTEPGLWPATKPDVPACDQGWLAPGTRRMLDRHLRADTRLVLELGAWLGKSTRFILDQAPQAHVISVDLWDATVIQPWIASRHPHLLPVVEAGVLETFLVNQWAWRDRITPLQMHSHKAIALVQAQGKVPDVVFLDTSHGYADTLAEVQRITRAFPHTHLVGDDWEWRSLRSPRRVGEDWGQPVARAVQAFLADNPQWKLQVDENGWALTPKEAA